MEKYKVGVIGATGLVGRKSLKYLINKNFNLSLYASSSSKGKIIEGFEVMELKEDVFKELDFALFFTPSSISKKYIPIAIKYNVRVIDNSSFYRLNDDVPLLIKGVNDHKINKDLMLISNPNCSTIQVLFPINIISKFSKIETIIYNTYQSISGIGKDGINAYYDCLEMKKQPIFPYNILNNTIPCIGKIFDDGYTEEENKMIYETKKILNQDIDVLATCIRVPVLYSHGVSVSIKLKDQIELNSIKEALKEEKNIILKDVPYQEDVNNSENIYVGRLRQSKKDKKWISFYCVADNLLVGAAYNACNLLFDLIK